MRPTLDTAQAAEHVGTTPEHVRKLAKQGQLPHWRVGSLYRFDRDELDAWLADRRVPHERVGGAA